jgi:preprotein translocase subunit SecG
MFGFVMVIHVIACIFLIIVVLLQAGKGGGLADVAGGNQTNSVFGTQTNTFMTRLTEAFAVIFVITSLSLAIMSSHRGKSLIESRRHDLPKRPVATQKQIPADVAEKAAAVPVEPATAPEVTATQTPATAAPAADATATQ